MAEAVIGAEGIRDFRLPPDEALSQFVPSRSRVIVGENAFQFLFTDLALEARIPAGMTMDALRYYQFTPDGRYAASSPHNEMLDGGRSIVKRLDPEVVASIVGQTHDR